MRFNKQPNPAFFSERQIRKFLIFPKTIDFQTRWLEFATVVQVYYPDGGWTDLKWK